MFIDIKRYKGKYQIDENGNVKSLNYRGNTKTEHLLKPLKRGNGYLYADLYDFDGKHHKENIHRLVAETFIENPNNLPCVNHKDENKDHNMIWVNDDGSIDYDKSNLEWCTHKYNSNYGTNPHKQSIKAKNSPTWQIAVEKSKIKVNQYDLNGNYIKTWNSFADIAKYLNIINASNIVACCKGKKKTSYGYKWSYEKI